MCREVRSAVTMRATSISFTLLTTFFTLCSCCFISNCPERRGKRIPYLGSHSQALTGKLVEALTKKATMDQLHGMPMPRVAKRDLRFMYSMLYNGHNLGIMSGLG